MEAAAVAPSADPARDEVLALPDGRNLSHATFGDLDGRPVVLCHGNPGSRLLCPDLPTTEAAGVQLLSVDRPGTGGSDPVPFHSLTDTARDVVAVLAELELDACTVVGWSAGAHQALALAATAPELVRSVVLVGAPGPPDDPALTSARSMEANRVIAGLRAHRADAFAALQDRFAGMARAPEQLLHRTLESHTDPDRRLMRDPVVADWLTRMWREGTRQGAIGLASTWAAQYALPWGFVVEDIELPVTVWHGRQDEVCPVGPVRRLAARLPHGRARLVRGGHLLPLEHWAEMLGE